MKKKIIATGAILFSLLLGYIFWPSSNTPQMAGGAGHAIPVSVMDVKNESVSLYTELPGRTVPYQIAEIRPQVTGLIKDRLFEEGSNVKEGQQLYQIDPAPYQAVYDSTKADLAKADANLQSVQAKNNRIKELLSRNAISKQDFDDSMASLAQAYADIAIAKAAIVKAKIDLDYTKVYAPISGRIGKSGVTKGALVTANQSQSLATITQLNPMYVDLTQASDELIQMRKSIESKKETFVELYLEKDSAPYAQKGVLQFTDVTVDQSTGSVQLRALFPNPEGLLLSGLFVRAKIETDAVESILIPQQAAIRGPDGQMRVWVVDKENTVNTRLVAIEKAIGDKWLVRDGLKAGETIVLEGFQKIAPGAVVAPAYAEEKTKNAMNVLSQQGAH